MSKEQISITLYDKAEFALQTIENNTGYVLPELKLALRAFKDQELNEIETMLMKERNERRYAFKLWACLKIVLRDADAKDNPEETINKIKNMVGNTIREYSKLIGENDG